MSDINPQDDTIQASEESQHEQTTQQNPPQDEISELRAELEKMTEMAKRTMADLQNFKRRQDEERVQMIFTSNARLIKELIPVFDNLKRSLTHMPGANEEWEKGIQMSVSQFEKALQQFGLEPIKALGEKFDPDLHEALVEGPGKKDTIIEELEMGYKLGNQVLRHSKVKVGNGE